jgi:hypothetical protein
MGHCGSLFGVVLISVGARWLSLRLLLGVGGRHSRLWWHRGWTFRWFGTLAISINLVCQLHRFSTLVIVSWATPPGWHRSLAVWVSQQLVVASFACAFLLPCSDVAMFQSGTVVCSDNFQFHCISISPRIDGWCLIYWCRVLARRAGDSVTIALVLLNIICRDCLWIGGMGRWV